MLLISEVFADLLLGIAAYLDIRHKKIPAVLPVVGILFGGIFRCACREQGIWDLFMGMLPGGVLLFTAFLTNEKVGYGDGLMLLALGLALPLELCIMSLCMALVLGAAAGGVLLIAGRATGKSTIPFLPFLLAGYILMLGVYG